MANFLVLSLCNNDFAQGLDLATSTILDHGLEGCPDKAEQIKQVTIACLLHQCMLTNAQMGRPLLDDLEEIERIQRYFTRSLTVSFERHAPEADHDGGSRYIDVHSKLVYRY